MLLQAPITCSNYFLFDTIAAGA